ncbi:ABC transporter ATP-binding protein [Pararhizobium sp. LjRoot238]|uniref:ABC transporter ATP-binding protein n=1 Tax=Pararhizobium sp. LjRoot238 TaxID=3342293 RepID=UPI003ECE926B
MTCQTCDSKTHASGERQPILSVRDLTVRFAGVDQPILDRVSFDVGKGEVVALVGESGSGKSVTALSIMRLLPPGTTVSATAVDFSGQDLRDLSAGEFDHLRGGRLSMLFQQPQAMLDPTSRVGAQVGEPLYYHNGIHGRENRRQVVGLLSEVGIPDPSARADCYSYELSGGMAQRVMMAAALSAGPELLIADEPTTALDVTVQAQILRLLDAERRRRRLAVLLITHDLSVVSAVADRIIVMYAGRVVEEGPATRVLKQPAHPYTQALIRCSLFQADALGKLFSLPHGAVHARDLTAGCRFHPRCPVAQVHGCLDRCIVEEPHLGDTEYGCKARCWAATREDHAACEGASA